MQNITVFLVKKKEYRRCSLQLTICHLRLAGLLGSGGSWDDFVYLSYAVVRSFWSGARLDEVVRFDWIGSPVARGPELVLELEERESVCV